VKGKRQWQPRELRLVAEYLEKYYSKHTYQMRVRLGSLHPSLRWEEMTEEERRMVGVWRRWADAIVVTDSEVILIEAAIRPEPGDITKLLLYEKLLYHTPELKDVISDRYVVKELVYALEDPLVVELARENNIRVRYFKPDWVDDYLKLLYHRERRSPLTNLEDLK